VSFQNLINRRAFVGWSNPEGTRPHLGALLLGYYSYDGKLIYAGRVGMGMPVKDLADLRSRLEPLARMCYMGRASDPAELRLIECRMIGTSRRKYPRIW
jgi:ATP-dependent DNA ligase